MIASDVRRPYPVKVHNGTDAPVGPPVSGVRALELDGDISLYHPETGHAVVLNATASDIWRLLDGEHGVAGIVALLAAAYGTSPEAIHDDVCRVVADLTEHGFLPA